MLGPTVQKQQKQQYSFHVNALNDQWIPMLAFTYEATATNTAVTNDRKSSLESGGINRQEDHGMKTMQAPFSQGQGSFNKEDVGPRQSLWDGDAPNPFSIPFSGPNSKPASESDQACYDNVGGEWSVGWKLGVRRILHDHAHYCPGAVVEEKENTITWSFVDADLNHGAQQANSLKLILTETLSALP